MLFGLPWWAIIPIVAIVGGLILRYREQELKHEEKMRSGSKEINELRKIIQNLRSRIEHLESQKTSAGSDKKKNVPLDDIEIKDEYYSEDEDNQGNRVRN